jgi:DNA modification methylase
VRDFPDYKTVSVDSLIPYARNSRTHSSDQVGQIAASIKEFGFLNPIIVDGDNGIIAGHGRVLAAQKLGLVDLPVIEAGHLSDTQRRAYIIADNKLAMNADWDDEMLRVELDALGVDGFDLELTGFSLDEIADLQIEEVPEGLTDEDAVPESPDEPVSVLGDIWLLGTHRLACSDATNIDAIEKLMDGQKADMVFTDPPYNVAYEGKTKSAMTIQNDKMDDSEFLDLITSAFTNMYAAMNAGAPIYVTCLLEDGVFQRAFLAGGLKIQSILIWLKNTLVMGRKDYHYKHEPIIYGWKEGAAHFWQGGRDKTSIINCDKPPRNGQHPTMKPVELIEGLMGNSGRIDGIILDVFGGSGSTLIACEKTNRHCRMMELYPKYCDVIINRWQQYTGKEAVLESTGETFNSKISA